MFFFFFFFFFKLKSLLIIITTLRMFLYFSCDIVLSSSIYLVLGEHTMDSPEAQLPEPKPVDPCK